MMLKIENPVSGNTYGDGITWFRGSLIGKGGFGYVFVATLRNPKSKFRCYPSIMAVKSAEVSVSGSIQKEREILCFIKGCSDIIKCYGDETTIGQNGLFIYNLLIEYGSGGTLSCRIKQFGSCGLPEFEAKVYCKCILRGLRHIHELGYVHCDLKPDNIFLFPNRGTKSAVKFRAKIGDFGLAKRAKQKNKRKLNDDDEHWQGTPMYLSPEAVIDHLQESTSDIWAFGCIAIEMLTGKSLWDDEDKPMTAEEILGKIKGGGSSALSKIPDQISSEAKSFLKGCFATKPSYRFTAEMLLNHPFLDGDLEDGMQEFDEEIEDLNENESMVVLVSEGEDEYNNWDLDSEDDLCYYDSFEHNGSSTKEEGEEEEEEESSNTPLQVASEGLSNHYPVNFSIRAGVGDGT